MQTTYVWRVGEEIQKGVRENSQAASRIAAS